MNETKPPYGQPDIVRFGDEDASFKLLERASNIEETVVRIRSNRDEWLRAQAAAQA